MANEMKIRITADASQATTTMKATQANLNKIIKNQPGLEKAFADDSSQKNLDAINKNLSNVIGLVERAAQAIHMADPTISEAEARAKLYASTMESLGREYGGSATEAMKFLENLRDVEQGTVNAENSTKKMAVAQNNLATATKAAGTAAKTSSNYFKKLFNTTKNVLVFRWIMNTIKLVSNISDFLEESTKAAAEAEQVFSKLNTVFGETSGAMGEVVSLASQIGVASSTAASALSTVGDLLQAQGQTATQSLQTASEWVSQFQDIIAFKDINMSLEEFAQNFMSGAAGNLRNFRTFGSIVKESAVNAELAKKGLDKLTGSELELAKMTTRAEMALEQQKNAIGATQREWDSMLSVNRRYEEAVKGLKESLGDWANDVIKPIKKWWTEVLEEINKASKAQEEFLSGKKNISVYDLSDESDFNAFYEKISSAISTGFYDESSGMQYSLLEAESAIIKFGASAEDVEKVIKRLYNVFEDSDVFASGDKFSTFIDKLRKSLKSVETDRDFEKQMEDWNNGLKDLAENADAFVEALAELKGVEGVSSDYISMISGNISSEKIAMHKRNAINENIKKNIETAIKSITETSLENYSNITETLFEEDSVQKAYTTWLDEIESMYVILYNRMVKYGDVTQEQLDEVYSKWKEIYAEADKYSKLESAFQTGATNGSYATDIRLKTRTNLNQSFLEGNYGPVGAEVPEGLAQAYAEIDLYYEDLINTTTLAFEERQKLYKLREEEKLQARDYLTILQKENKEKEKASKLEELATGTADYKKQLSQFGMTDYEKTIDDLVTMLESINDIDIRMAIQEQIQAYEQLTKKINETTEAETKAQAWEALGENFSSSFGEFETLVTMWGSLDDVTGGLGSLLGILVDIVAQTEVVTRLGSILTDSILPVLNAFLEPLLPVIDMVSQSISLLVESVLVPFYPILQGLSSILVVVFGLLNAGINYFVDGVKMLAGKVVEGIQSMINGIIDLINNIPFVDIGHVRFKASEWADIDPDKNLEKNLQVMEEQLNRIAGYTMETAENTESDDYETYRRLLQAKEITDEQYARLTHQDVYSTKTVGNGVTYTSGGKQSYVSINNLAVQVPAGMTLEEFLKNLGDYSNGNLPFGVNTISA